MTHDTKQDERIVFITNLGSTNYMRSKCLDKAKPTVCGIIRLGCYDDFRNSDSKGFIKHCITSEKTDKGNFPDKKEARKWYNRIKEVENSSDEYWIHREDDKIWWTKTHNKEAFFEQSPNPSGELRWICYKDCMEWSDCDKNGKPLRISRLNSIAIDAVRSVSRHSKAVKYAAYLRALINGNDLSEWNNLSS